MLTSTNGVEDTYAKEMLHREKRIDVSITVQPTGNFAVIGESDASGGKGGGGERKTMQWPTLPT
jgi:hypothetical protein